MKLLRGRREEPGNEATYCIALTRGKISLVTLGTEVGAGWM